MLNFLLALGLFSFLFVLLSLSAALGRQLGKKKIASHPENKLEVLNVAEGAVFALLGLMIAFTFSGAYERFETRKVQIIDEGNAIETAYMRIGLLDTASQPALRANFLKYVDSRIVIYEQLPNFVAAIREWHKSLEIRADLWNELLAACKETGDSSATELTVPAFNDMFDLANTRYASTRIHSSILIYIELVGLAALSSLLAGYATAKSKLSKSIYIFIYVLITSFTLYLIIDLEFPLMGMIRIDAFNHVLVDVRKDLK